MIAWLRKLFGPNVRELLHLAIERAARLSGELEEAEVRREFYALLVVGTDPNVDWWRYAVVRQKLQDARDECLQINKLVVAALAEVNALMKLP